MVAHTRDKPTGIDPEMVTPFLKLLDCEDKDLKASKFLL